jgi:hypothetical protein
VKTFRWSHKQLALISAIYSIGDVWAIGAKRSGKSTAIVEAIRQCVYEWEPDVNGIMAAPSYGQIERNFMEGMAGPRARRTLPRSARLQKPPYPVLRRG